jgi:hypothetical protein
MSMTTYQYSLDFFRDDGSPLAQVPVAPDWEPALEWVCFEGVRQGQLPADTAAGRGAVEPTWHALTGQPYVSGFRVVVPTNGDGVVSRDIPRSYLRGHVQQASAALVEKGILKRGDTFRYLVSAYPSTAHAAEEALAVADFSVEEVVQPLPLREAGLESFFCDSVPAGSETVDGDMPVFVPHHVLTEALQLARQAGDSETGGVLVGLLRRDSSVPEIFVEITAQIAAPHTRSSSTKLTFTADTWTAVRAALTLRKRGELMLGWWHYHPDFCRLRDCPVERRRSCTASSAFFSAEDVHLHRTCFPRAYQIAVLVSDNTAQGLSASLYGWRQGMVTQRGFHIIGAVAEAVDSQPGSRQSTVQTR